MLLARRSVCRRKYGGELEWKWSAPPERGVGGSLLAFWAKDFGVIRAQLQREFLVMGLRLGYDSLCGLT